MGKMMSSGYPWPESGTPSWSSFNTRMRLKDGGNFLEEEHTPISKRPRISYPSQQWGMETNSFPPLHSQCNSMDNPSPIGLRLTKTPSLMESIMSRINHGVSSQNPNSPQLGSSIVKDHITAAAAPGGNEKFKASNFAISVLKIGQWECESKYDGDLVAKCYFAKRKLVWEVLEGGLKSKIEIQWSDIKALSANCPEQGPSTLTIVLAKPPLFYRETNPQPRKHTMWQATTDFTNGHASTYRQHFLQCPEGALEKNFEKLIQSDKRLHQISQQPNITLHSPCFQPRPSTFEDPEHFKNHTFSQLDRRYNQYTPDYVKFAPLPVSQTSSFETDSGMFEYGSLEAPSPCSVMDAGAIQGRRVDLKDMYETRDQRHLNLFMSDKDFINSLERQELKGIAEYLLSDDTPCATTASNETFLQPHVDSLSRLLQNGPAEGIWHDGSVEAKDTQQTYNVNAGDGFGSKQTLGILEMDCEESYGELLMTLSRIASPPRFLDNVLD